MATFERQAAMMPRKQIAQQHHIYNQIAIPGFVAEVAPAKAGHRIIVMMMQAEPVGADGLGAGISYGLLSDPSADTIIAWQGGDKFQSEFGIACTDIGEALWVGNFSAQTIRLTVVIQYQRA